MDYSRSSTLLNVPTLGDNIFAHTESEKDDDWRLCIHSQGWIYFYHPRLKIVTDHDIREPGILAALEDSRSHYPLDDLTDGMEVQLVQTRSAAKVSENSFSSWNLTINHKHCVASYNFEEVRNDNPALLGPNRLNRCRRLYWNYLWKHPSHVPTPPRAIEDASDALTWFYTDNLISGQKSTVPFSKSECEELSRVVRDLALPSNTNSISKTTFLAWLMREVCSYRDAESWGQHTQKSYAERTQKFRSHQSTTNPPPFIDFIINFVINVLFFGIPHTYRAHVKATSEFRGRLSNVQKNWESYVERLVREYSHFLLISTVLLSATVGFLAVPDVPEGAQVAAYISTFASLGSIIVGVFSIWRHQANTRTADSYTYMHNIQHNYFGFYGHAILLSLPPTLLVWAILTFTISVVASILNTASGAAWTKLSTWSVVAIFIVLLLAVLLALYTFSIVWTLERRTAKIWHRLTTFCLGLKIRTSSAA
ncbi:hypothetical protein CVT26_000200 [Gymnopilus dilepis]|uniref:WW domain-containing protein n=1 Tax=Gymnopilus dilepis TaxID=231916 RepID=A0A409VG39_9AGAR|nr:hypothetical protein CVT26_000200 [Gymnopilus dilepis]